MFIQAKKTSLFYKAERINKISIPVFCFVILYTMYLLKRIYVFGNNQWLVGVFDLLEWPVYIFVFLYENSKIKYRMKDIWVILGVGVVFFMAYCTTGYAELLKALLLIITLRRTNYKELFEVMYRILIVSVVFTVLLYLLGISDAGIMRREATAIGYSNPSTVGYVLMNIALLAIAARGGITVHQKIVLGIVNFVGFLLTDCRTGFILTLAALLLDNKRIYLFMKRFRPVCILLMSLPVILLSITVLTAKLYENNVLVQSLDPLFSGRISLNWYNLTMKGVTLLGQRVEYHGIIDEEIYNPITNTWAHYMTIDNSYVSLLVEFGILATIVVLIAYFMLIKKLYKYGMMNIVLIMSLLCLHGMMESSTFSIYVSFPFILLFNEGMETRTQTGGAI